MNTVMTIQAYGSKSKEALTAVKKRVEELERTLSTTLVGSDIYTLNNSDGKPVAVHQDTAFLFDFTSGMYKATEEALNPALYPIIKAWGFTTGDYKVPSGDEIAELLTHTDFSAAHLIQDGDVTKLQLEKGMKLDFGAVGKGYAADEIVQILQEKGVKNALLDLGGNIQALGKKTDGSLSELKILGEEMPFVPLRLLIKLLLQAAATSDFSPAMTERHISTFLIQRQDIHARAI